MRLRGAVKTVVVEALARSGMWRYEGAAAGSRTAPLILAYHHVVPDFETASRDCDPSTFVSLRMLEQQLEWVGRHYRFAGLDEVASGLRSGAPFATPVAAVTFDDGYADVYEHALPLLRGKGIPAAVFVTTDLVGTARVPAHDRLYSLFAHAGRATRSTQEVARILIDHNVRRPGWRHQKALGDPSSALRACLTTRPFARVERLLTELEARVPPDPQVLKRCRAMDWSMLSDLHRQGWVIGSHTRRHILLPGQPVRITLGELAGSRRMLERKLGVPIRHFAYPDGRFTSSVVRQVARAGYHFGFGTCRYRDRVFPCLTVPRRPMWEHTCVDASLRFSPFVMSCEVSSLFDLVRRCPHNHRDSAVRSTLLAWLGRRGSGALPRARR